MKAQNTANGLSFQQLTDSTVLYYLKLRDYEKALYFAIPRRDSIRLKHGARSLDYANACRSLGDMLVHINRFEEAETCFLPALSLADSLLEEGDRRRTTYFSTYAYFLKQNGLYQKATVFYRKALAVHQLTNRRDSLLLADMELHLGQAFHFSNRFREAEPILQHCLELYIKLWGPLNQDVAVSWHYLSEFYLRTGNYGKAADCSWQGLKSLGISEDMYSLIWSAELKMQLGFIRVKQGNYRAAAQWYREALDDLAKASGTSGEVMRKRGEILKGLGGVDYKCKDFSRAGKRFLTALQVVEGMLPETHQDVQELRLNLASTVARLGRRHEADSLFALVRPRMEANMGKESAQLNFLRLEEALLALAKGRRQEALQHIDSLEQNILRQLDAIFLNFAATENEAFLLSLEEYRSWISGLLASEAEKQPALASLLLDVHLQLHGILLSSERSVLQDLRRQNEPVLAQKAEAWFALRKQLAALQANGKIKADSLSAFEEKVNSLEKELIRQRSNRKGGFSANNRAGAEIQKTLKKGQAAVQIIRVTMPGMVSVQDRSDSLHRRCVYPEITDTIHYLALIIKPGTAHPALVSLRRGNWLERQGLANYRNQIRRQQEDPLSYGLFWQAIDSALGPEVKEVFYCPDGVYHSLNPASVLVPGKGRYLSGLRSWVRLTRLADLTEPAPERNNQKRAVLIGAPAFADGYRLDGGEEEESRFEPLPGTLAEVNSVNQAMQKSGWKTNCFTGTTASEEAVKNLRSPAVLHLATHGYFRQDTLGGSHAMLSSGLILAGPDKSYPTDSSRREDGILKAREAQTLDLEGTDLVVLSACETGLGTSQNGEGMYGLQRAFQLAGCRRVLMSLWKIDDEATSRLMKAFYKFYLPSGNAQDALLKAQTELRKSYPHPYYWASFLVMGR